MQKVGYGQPVQVVGTLGSNGWSVESVAARALEFAPRVRGSGAVVRLDLPGGVRHVLRVAPDGGIAGWVAGTDTTFDKLAKAGNALKWTGIGLGIIANGARQWAQDADQDDLTGKQRAARVAYRSATVTAAQFGGGLAGGAGAGFIGAGIGSLFCPGAGTVVGGLAGRVIGGHFGARWAGAGANALVDRTIDSVGRGDLAGVRDDMAELASEVDEFRVETGEKVAEMIPALLKFLLM